MILPDEFLRGRRWQHVQTLAIARSTLQLSSNALAAAFTSVSGGKTETREISNAHFAFSVGMELGQVLNEEQRKERFSHSLHQKRVHKQMSVENSPVSSTSSPGLVTFPAKAPKLETKTLLQKFLDGRRTENHPKVEVDVGTEESSCTPKLTYHQKLKGTELKMKVGTDLDAQEIKNSHQSQGIPGSIKMYSPWSPTIPSRYQRPDEIYPSPPIVRHQSIFQPPQTWPNLFWGFHLGWESMMGYPANLICPSYYPRPPFEDISRIEPDTTTPSENIEDKSEHKMRDKDQLVLKLREERDKKMVMDYIHKKFRRTDSSLTYQPPQRPSVIVSSQSFKEKQKMKNIEEDIDDILTTSSLSDVSDLSELCNISDVGEEELLDITSICELYFLEESISSHVEDTQKDFFAEWKHIPLGEKMMEIYIDFSKGDIKMPPSWMTLASSATRWVR